MRAGSLARLVTIEQPASDRNDYGEQQITWIPIATRWASVTPLSGRELFTAQQIQPDVTHGVSMRFMAGLTSSMRVRYAGRVLNIASILNADEDGNELKLLCMERV